MFFSREKRGVMAQPSNHYEGVALITARAVTSRPGRAHAGTLHCERGLALPTARAQVIPGKPHGAP